MLNNKKILITGGTGSFGKKCVEIILNKYKPKKVVIFSRDELKQHEMQLKYNSKNYPISFFIGNVREWKGTKNVDTTDAHTTNFSTAF